MKRIHLIRPRYAHIPLGEAIVTKPENISRDLEAKKKIALTLTFISCFRIFDLSFSSFNKLPPLLRSRLGSVDFFCTQTE